jgi:uncharacterized glyoxalase superfamily protein PhnB
MPFLRMLYPIGSVAPTEVEVNTTRFRVGLRVDDVRAATLFYCGLGFGPLGSVPDPAGRRVMTILERDGVLLIVDALEGMPFPASERERLTKEGPRGLGVALGLGVNDLDAVFDFCSEAGCTITCEPMGEAWGERLFECIDPFGYQWEFSRPIDETAPADGLAAVRTSWFGEQQR